MLDRFFESRFTQEQLRNGPNGPWLAAFARALHEQGYSWWTSRTYLRAAHHLGHFLRNRGVALVDVQPDIVVAFRLHLKRCRCPNPRGGMTEDTVRGVMCFLRHLRTTGTIAEPAQQPLPQPVAEFRHWLCCHRGLSETTLLRYSAAAVEFLSELGNDPDQYDAEHVRAFLINRSRRRGAGSTRAILSAIRLFLRYLAAAGKCSPGLDTAVPAIAGWRLATLPRCLSVDEVEQLLTACDQTFAMGIGDRAMILLLARLGLRASDVAALRFGDIDWSNGSIVVKGKCRQQARLPLPQEVGDAIVRYLECRPHAASEHVFLRCIAPFRALPAPSVSQVVRRVMRRASVRAPTYGSHILRHYLPFLTMSGTFSAVWFCRQMRTAG
jgi:site-specific recombinase XerD